MSLSVLPLTARNTLPRYHMNPPHSTTSTFVSHEPPETKLRIIHIDAVHAAAGTQCARGAYLGSKTGDTKKNKPKSHQHTRNKISTRNQGGTHHALRQREQRMGITSHHITSKGCLLQGMGRLCSVAGATTQYGQLVPHTHTHTHHEP